MTRKLEIMNKIITSASISSHVHTLSFSVYSHPLIKVMRWSNFKTTLLLHNRFADDRFITSCSAPPHGGCGCIWNQRASSHSGTPEWGKGCDDRVLPCHQSPSSTSEVRTLPWLWWQGRRSSSCGQDSAARPPSPPGRGVLLSFEKGFSKWLAEYFLLCLRLVCPSPGWHSRPWQRDR